MSLSQGLAGFLPLFCVLLNSFRRLRAHVRAQTRKHCAVPAEYVVQDYTNDYCKITVQTTKCRHDSRDPVYS